MFEQVITFVDDHTTSTDGERVSGMSLWRNRAERSETLIQSHDCYIILVKTSLGSCGGETTDSAPRVQRAAD